MAWRLRSRPVSLPWRRRASDYLSPNMNSKLEQFLQKFRVSSPFRPRLEVTVWARNAEEAITAAIVKRRTLAGMTNLRALPA